MFDKLKDKWKSSNNNQKAMMAVGGAAGVAASPVLAPVATALSPVLGVAAGAKKFHDDRTKRPGWNRKQMLRADMARLNEGPQALGLAEADRQRMLDEQMQASNAQAQAQQAAIAQQALAGGEFQQNAFAGAQQDVAQTQQAAAAAAQADVESKNQQHITQEANRIRADIAQKQAENEANTKYWTDKGINLALNIATMAAGMPGLAAGAGTGMTGGGGGGGAAPAAPAGPQVIQVPGEPQGPTGAVVTRQGEDAWDGIRYIKAG